MKNILFILFSLYSLTLFSQNYIVKDVDIIPIYKNEVLIKQSVLIENGVIVEIGPFKDIVKKKNGSVHKIINAKGKYLMPGLADMHVHLKEDSLVEMQLLNYIAAGVTHIRVMESKGNQLKALAGKVNNQYPISPNIFFSRVIKRDESYSESGADSLMRKIKNDGLSFVKLFGLSDKSTFYNVMNAAKEHHITVCGHYPTYYPYGKGIMLNADTVFNMQFKSIEHLSGYVNYPESYFEDLVKQTKAYEIYNCPTLDWDIMAYNLQFPEEYKKRITFLSLPENITLNWEKEYANVIEQAGGKEKVIESKDKYKPIFDKKIKLLKILYDANCLLLVGGDGGNSFQFEGFNMYEEMVNWSKIGIDNYTILKSATYNAAKFFKQENQWGTITKGSKAEILILDKNPLQNINNISTARYTISNGVLYENKKMISKMKA